MQNKKCICGTHCNLLLVIKWCLLHVPFILSPCRILFSSILIQLFLQSSWVYHSIVNLKNSRIIETQERFMIVTNKNCCCKMQQQHQNLISFYKNVTITVTIFPLKWPRMLNNGHLAPKGNIIWIVLFKLEDVLLEGKEKCYYCY